MFNGRSQRLERLSRGQGNDAHHVPGASSQQGSLIVRISAAPLGIARIVVIMESGRVPAHSLPAPPEAHVRLLGWDNLRFGAKRTSWNLSLVSASARLQRSRAPVPSSPPFNHMVTPGRSLGLGLALVVLAGCGEKQITVAEDITAPVVQPVWKVGDEWEYRYDGSSGSGTFVWRVDRTENLGGVPHYVVTAGTREIFYRVDDLGFTRETLEGKVVREISPSTWRVVAFPLRVGQSWSMKYVERRPPEQQPETVDRRCVAEGQETVTVPAGAFATIRIVCTNTLTNAWVLTLWYSPVVHHLVKDEYPVRTGGRASRELLRFRLR